jgi:chromosomal replication initiation ATPase DnaA
MSTLLILVTTCRELGVAVGDVRGPVRKARLAIARREVARRCSAAGYSLPAIGRILCRHHSSVLWMLRGGRHGKSKRRMSRVTARWLISMGAGL